MLEGLSSPCECPGPGRAWLVRSGLGGTPQAFAEAIAALFATDRAPRREAARRRAELDALDLSRPPQVVPALPDRELVTASTMWSRLVITAPAGMIMRGK